VASNKKYQGDQHEITYRDGRYTYKLAIWVPQEVKRNADKGVKSSMNLICRKVRDVLWVNENVWVDRPAYSCIVWQGIILRRGSRSTAKARASTRGVPPYQPGRVTGGGRRTSGSTKPSKEEPADLQLTPAKKPKPAPAAQEALF
jgi:hypothetical protein